MKRLRVLKENVTFNNCTDNVLILNINKTVSSSKLNPMIKYIQIKYNLGQDTILKPYMTIDYNKEVVSYVFYIDEDSVEFYDLDYDNTYEFNIKFGMLEQNELEYIEQLQRFY